jgi:hypothetical protein
MKPNDENSKLPTEKRPLRILIIWTQQKQNVTFDETLYQTRRRRKAKKELDLLTNYYFSKS